MLNELILICFAIIGFVLLLVKLLEYIDLRLSVKKQEMEKIKRLANVAETFGSQVTISLTNNTEYVERCMEEIYRRLKELEGERYRVK